MEMFIMKKITTLALSELSAISGGIQYICQGSKGNIYSSNIKDEGKNFEENESYKSKVIKSYKTAKDCGDYCCVANEYDYFVFRSFGDDVSPQEIARQILDHTEPRLCPAK